MKLKEIIKGVPDYQFFKSVEELNDDSSRLAEKYPDVVRTEVIGQSRGGSEIIMEKIGRGKKNVLLFACPHPNEPVGSMMLSYLAEKLAADAQFRQEFDLTWYLIKCIDPDGTSLNQGWFKGPFTPLNYATNFFRPASYEQIEWTFPVDYKNYQFSDPLPETRALMQVIKQTKPVFMYSLHNAGFGGAFFYLSGEHPAIYNNLTELVTERGLPLHLGEPEVPYAVKFSDGIFKIPSLQDSYDFLAANSGQDPAKILSGGSSSFAYIKKYNPAAFCLVCELPYFYDSKIKDRTKMEISRKEAVLKSLEISKMIIGFVEMVIAETAKIIELDSPFQRAVIQFAELDRKSRPAKKSWVENNPEFSEAATVAQYFDNVTLNRFYKMLTLGMLIRHLELAVKKGVNSLDHPQLTKLKGLLTQARAYLEQVNSELEAELDYRVVPIKKLVEIQLASALQVLLKIEKNSPV